MILDMLYSEYKDGILMTKEEIEEDEFNEYDDSFTGNPTYTTEIKEWLFDIHLPDPEAVTRRQFERRKPAMNCPSIEFLQDLQKHYDTLPPVQQRKLYKALRGQMLRFLISCDGINTMDGLLQILRNEMETKEPAEIPTWYTFRTTTMGMRKTGYYECSNRACDKTETLKERFSCCSSCKMPNYCSKKCQVEDWKIQHKYVCKTAKTNRETLKNVGKFMQVISDLSLTNGFENAMASGARKGQTWGEMASEAKKNNKDLRKRRKQIREEKKRPIGEKPPKGPDPKFY